MSNVIPFGDAARALPSARAKVARESERFDREYRADNIRAFLNSVRLLRGIDYTCQPEIALGRGYIEQMALSLRDERVPMPTLKQCCDALEFLSYAVPTSARACFGHGGADEACGYTAYSTPSGMSSARIWPRGLTDLNRR